MKKQVGAVALASALTLGGTTANAGVIAMADLAILAFGIVDASTLMDVGGPTFVTDDINILSDSRTGNSTASLNGVDATGVGPSSDTVFTGNLDIGHRCIGSCDAALYGGSLENDTTTKVGTFGNGDYALGDMFVSGDVIGASGAQGLTRADVAIDNASQSGNGNATLLNTAQAETTVSFQAGGDIEVALFLQYDLFLRAAIDALSPDVTGSAGAGVTFSVTVTSSDTDFGTGGVLVFLPIELNTGVSAFDAGDLDDKSVAGVAISAVEELKAGEIYNVNITQSSNANASLIPVPATLALFGLGLIGVGAAARRKRMA